MEAETLPGLQALYWFVPGGDAVDLRLSLSFDPSQAGEPATVRRAWLALRDRLAGGDSGRSETVELVTSLTLETITATVDGVALRERLADFAASVVAGLEEGRDPIGAVELAFGLARGEATISPSDFFQLMALLDLGEGPPDPDGVDPVPDVLLAAPRFVNDDPSAFAATFEEAWKGFDGGDGVIRLALELAPGPPSLWCVRTGQSCGIGIAASAKPATALLAVPPLSNRPLAGMVRNIDGEGADERFEAVDLDAWWEVFAYTFDRLARHEVAQTFFFDEPPGRLGPVHSALGRALADRLLTLDSHGSPAGLDDARKVFENAAASELSSRPVIGSVAVEVKRGAVVSGEPSALLWGGAATPSGTSVPAHSTAAALRLDAGEQRLNLALPPVQWDQRSQALPARFVGGSINRPDASPLWLLGAQGPGDRLALDIDPQPAPAPLIALPRPSSFAGVTAKVSPGADNVSDALRWTVEAEMILSPEIQDRLELTIGFEARPPARGRACAADGDLFGALARIVRFMESTSWDEEESEPEELDRFADLAAAVAEALPDWRAPAGDVPSMPVGWDYAIDFADLPALTVTRNDPGSDALPPWPALAGFVTPMSEAGRVARYEPEGDGPPASGLRISTTGLRLLGHRTAQLHARIRRNGALTAAIDPAFVYHTDIVSSEAGSPSLEWEAPRPQGAEPSLAASLDSLLDPIDEDSGGSYVLGLAAELVRGLPAGDPLEIRIPLAVLPPVRIGPDEESSSLSEVKQAVARALSEARSRLALEGPDSEIALAVTLSGLDRNRAPLARLHVRIPIADDPTWWTGEEPRPA